MKVLGQQLVAASRNSTNKPSPRPQIMGAVPALKRLLFATTDGSNLMSTQRI